MKLSDKQLSDLRRGNKSQQHVQTLWAGYGSVTSTALQVIGDNGKKKKENVIVKRVEPPPSSGVSHERKIRSYEVEAFFYDQLVPKYLLKSSKAVVVPEPYHIESNSPSQFMFVLSDLRDAYPENAYLSHRRGNQTEAALAWLANFHAVFWEEEDALSNDDGRIWECGGYWHLDTRLDEYEDIVAREWQDLKDAAFAIDKRLKRQDNDDFTFYTLCHGDFKQENLLFNQENDVCAAVDFQYTGVGYGMKDVVMLIVSSVSRLNDDEELEILLKNYHSSLLHALEDNGKGDSASSYTFDIALGHFYLCLMDYVRFMAGWGFWGSNSCFAEQKVKSLLKTMKERHENDISTTWEERVLTSYPR